MSFSLLLKIKVFIRKVSISNGRRRQIKTLRGRFPAIKDVTFSNNLSIMGEVTRAKWRWEVYANRREDDKWTKKIMQWWPRNSKWNMGRPPMRWVDDIIDENGTKQILWWTYKWLNKGWGRRTFSNKYLNKLSYEPCLYQAEIY